ncbi:MAG: hypothetical protein WBE76_19910 [Terracidiphilus sp.]
MKEFKVERDLAKLIKLTKRIMAEAKRLNIPMIKKQAKRLPQQSSQSSIHPSKKESDRRAEMRSLRRAASPLDRPLFSSESAPRLDEHSIPTGP